MKNNYVLGIDTSNYKTSIALVGEEGIVWDIRKFLEVKPGERGLRQSEALFQHVKNLPELFEKAMIEHPNYDRSSIKAVAFSTKPRPVEGSYMPCFLAGSSFGRSIASVLGVPTIETTHQEGHIAAIEYGNSILKADSTEIFLACHFSGGTCELLQVRDLGNSNYDIEILGGTRDISYGQVLDRMGVLLGLAFPCGEALDKIALANKAKRVNTSSDEIKVCDYKLSKIKVKDGWINLSGFETQIKNTIVNSQEGSAKANEWGDLIEQVFLGISDSMGKMIHQVVADTGIRRVVISGGVASSEYIKAVIEQLFQDDDIELVFGDGKLSSDNGIGVAILGYRALCR